MKIYLAVFILSTLVLCQSILGQPGGGGGIQIEKIIDKNLQLISKSDPELKITRFLLGTDSTHKVLQLYSAEAKYHYRTNGKPNHIFLPPYIYLPTFKSKNAKRTSVPNQRIMLIYKKDTMIIDFIDILMENGAGYTDYIEVLKLYPGYFTCYRNIRNRLPIFFNESAFAIFNAPKLVDTLNMALKKGINDETLPMLYQYKLLEHNKDLKPYIFFENSRYDTLFLAHAPVDSLPYKNIQIKGNNIQIKTTASPIITDSGLQYKFLLPSFATIKQKHFIEITDKEGQQKYLLFINTSIPTELYINHKKFTGILKLFIPGQFGLSRRVCEYREGKLIKTIELPAVKNAIDEELFVREISWDV